MDFLKKIIKYGLILLGVVSFFIVCLLLAIKIFFPAEELKKIAENKLGEILKKQVSVEMVQFNPFSGIALKNISIRDKTLPFIFIKDLSLMYDFSKLLKRKFIINSIRINEPTINLRRLQNGWNIPLIEPDVNLKDETEPAADNEKLSIPALPFAIDLNEFIIKDMSLSLNDNNNIIAECSGINLLLTGQMSPKTFYLNALITSSAKSGLSFRQTFPQKIEFSSTFKTKLNITPQNLGSFPIKGKIIFKNLSAFYQNKIELNHFSIAFDLLMDIMEGNIGVNNISLASDNFFKANISGRINQIFQQPRFDISLTNSTVELQKINPFISPFIPFLNTHGLIGIKNIHLVGSLNNGNKLQTNVQGLLFLDNISVNDLKSNLSLKNVSGNIKLNKLVVKNNLPDKIDTEIELHLEEFKSPTFSLNGLQQHMRFYSSEEVHDEQIMNFDFKFNEIKFHIEDENSTKFPITVNGFLVSNLANLDIKKLQIKWDMQELAAGKITVAYLSSNHNRFTVENIIRLNLGKVGKYIPLPYSKRIKELNLSGNFSSTANFVGNLNNQYFPEKLDFKLKNNLKNVNANSLAYNFAISDFNAKIFSEGRYGKKKEVEFPVLKIDGNFLNIKYSDQVIIEKSNYSFALKDMGPFSLEEPFGMHVNLSGKVKSSLANLTPNKTKINQLGMNLAIGGIISKEKFLEKIKLSGDIAAKNIQVGDEVFFDNALVAFKADSPFLLFEKPSIEMDLSTNKLKLNHKDQPIFNHKIASHMLLSPDLQKKSVVIKDMNFTGLPLFHISMKEGVFDTEQNFDIKDFIFFLDAKSFWDRLPKDIRKKIPVKKASGVLHASISAKGQAPLKINPMDLNFLTHLNSALKLEKINLELKQHNIKLNNLGFAAKVNLDKDKIHLEGRASVDTINSDFESAPPKISGISYQYDYSLKDFNIFNIKKSLLEIESGMISQSLDGAIEGFNYLLSPNSSFKPVEILERIKLKINSTVSIKSAEKLSLTGPLNLKGGFKANTFINLIPKKNLSLNGTVEFKNFTLSHKNFLVENLKGNIPINKSYFLKTMNSAKPLEFSDKIISQSKLFSNLRNYSVHKDLISVSGLQVGNQTLSHMLLDLYLKENRFAVEQFSFELEGGPVLGNLFLLPTKTGHKLFLKANFANMDLSKIFKIKSPGKNSIDSQVNGNTEFTIHIVPGSKGTEFSLDQIEMILNITRIGEKALNQIIMFLDPNESNPSMANLKDKLKLARPSHIKISLKNERLSMYAQIKTSLIQNRIIKLQVLDKIPIQRLKQFSIFTESLNELSPFLKIITLWSSNYILLKQNQFIFR